MRAASALTTVLVAGCALIASLALPWYGAAPPAVETQALTGNWEAFVALLDRQRILEATVRGWSAPGASGPLLLAAALLAAVGSALIGTPAGRALMAVGSVGALAVCAVGLLRVPAGALELRLGVWVSLACALVLLSATWRASAA